MQNITYSDNNSVNATPVAITSNHTDLFIDFDGLSGWSTPGGILVKGTIGDVEVFDCTECGDPCTLNEFIVK